MKSSVFIHALSGRIETFEIGWRRPRRPLPSRGPCHTRKKNAASFLRRSFSVCFIRGMMKIVKSTQRCNCMESRRLTLFILHGARLASEF